MFAWLRVLRQELVEETIETFVLVQRGSGDVAPRTRTVGGQVFLVPDRLLDRQQRVGAEQRSVTVSVPLMNEMERVDDRLCVQVAVRARNGWVVSRIVGVRQLLAEETRVAETHVVASARAAWAAEAQPAALEFARLLQDWGHGR
ncbi:MAG: hypothetical protein IPK26_20780 [Planctomycetes bacterium]|nr:hypothetical protein [Planctomycetota bacterium]